MDMVIGSALVQHDYSTNSNNTNVESTAEKLAKNIILI